MQSGDRSNNTISNICATRFECMWNPPYLPHPCTDSILESKSGETQDTGTGLHTSSSTECQMQQNSNTIQI